MNKSKITSLIFGILLMLLISKSDYANKINIKKESKIVRVGILKFPFLSSSQKQYKNKDGLMTELLDSLFNHMGVAYVKVECNVDNALTLLKEGKIDVLPTENWYIENDTLLAKSYPIIKTSPVMITRRFVEKIPDMGIIIDREFILANKFEKINFNKSITDKFLTDPDFALDELKNKEIDAIICNSVAVNKILDCDEFNILKYKITKLNDIDFVYSFVVSKETNKELLQVINTGIEYLVYSGTKERILNQWNFYKGYREYIFKYELIYSFIIFLIIVLSLFIILYLRINHINYKRLKYKADINNIVLNNVEYPISVYRYNNDEPVYKNAKYLDYEKKYLKSGTEYTKYGARIKKINVSVVKNIIEKGRIYNRTNTDIFDNGKSISMLRYATTFKNTKNEVYICMVEMDITEIIEASLQAEKAEKLKSLFLANMSHDIRTPLNAIVGFVDLLEEEDSDKEILKYSQIISKNTDYLLSLLNDTVDLARFKVGDTKDSFTWFDFKSTLEASYNIFDLELKKMDKTDDIKFVLHFPYKSFLYYGDINKMQRILSNYISNACKYTFHGTIDLGAYEADGNIYLFVLDTGIGISEDNIPKVFEKFTKLDEIASGTGLGMAIVRAIMENSLDGRADVISCKDKGSLFYVSRTSAMKFERDKDSNFSVINRVKKMIDTNSWIN